MTHGPNTSNHHPLYPRDDRETLSALFDGELPGDAARFALKRLDHDAGWRDTCGRWQLIGDALRGEATAAAPANFAAGVMKALVAEGHAAVAISQDTPADETLPHVVATRRRWFGGVALAASVAMVAVLVARPFSEPTSAPAQAQVAIGVAAPVQAERITQSAEAAPAVTASTTPSVATPTILTADTASASRHRPTRPARITRQPLRSMDDSATVVAAAEQTATQKPFHPPADQVATRPWPRAVLPETGSGGFTVGFGATSAPASSLYPFEPRLPEAQTPNQTMTEPQP